MRFSLSLCPASIDLLFLIRLILQKQSLIIAIKNYFTVFSVQIKVAESAKDSMQLLMKQFLATWKYKNTLSWSGADSKGIVHFGTEAENFICHCIYILQF